MNPPPLAAGYRWIDTADGLDELVDELVDEPVVGLDTEFHRERTYYPTAALLQFGWPGGIALVDALAVDLAPVSRAVTGRTIVMHAGAQDIEVLVHACQTPPTTLFDTQLAAGFAGFSSPSLAALVSSELGVRVAKGDRLADWMRRPLPTSQLEYAAADVEHLLGLHSRLAARLAAAGRLGWAEDECAALVRRATAPRDPAKAWWRVKEARQLRGQAIGIAQCVGEWRDLRAAEIDQPVRFVLPDLALVSIAARPPRDEKALRQVRGLDDRHLRRGGAAGILGAVRRGRQLPPDEYRMPPSGEIDRDLRPAVTLVSAWLSQLSRQLDIDTALVGTRADVEALLRGDPDARLANGWRKGLVGDAIRRLVDGEAALAFDGHGGLLLEPRPSRSGTDPLHFSVQE